MLKEGARANNSNGFQGSGELCEDDAACKAAAEKVEG